MEKEFAKTEVQEIVLMGRLYKVTASPSLLMDKYPLVEVLVAETTNRSSHFRRLPHGLKRDQIAFQAYRLNEAEKGV